MNLARKHIFVRVLTRLSEASGLYPDSLTLTDVIFERGRRGGGGFADVYKGIWLGKDIALKVFKYPLPAGVDTLNALGSCDDGVRDLLREFITWRQLSHPNILPFYGVYFLDDSLDVRFCLVSPWMENGNMVEFLDRRNRMAPNTDTTNCVSLVRRFPKIWYCIRYGRFI
jgi:Protein tyrosine and serine/threonine kinase